MRKIKIGIIGGGQWANALGALVKRAGHSVGGSLLGADLWLVAVPAEFFRIAVSEVASDYKGQPIIICTKGLEPKTHLFMSEVLAKVIPKCVGHIGVLSGPQFAAEVVRKVPTGSTLAGSAKVREIGRVAFGEFYLEETDDIIGTELCGCGKNAAAIVAGFYSVRAKGENERAMMLSRAWAEVAHLGEKIGAKLRTFIGLCGTGDLFLSAASPTSRNFSAGVAIARRRPLVGTVEGVSAIRGITFRAKKFGFKTPVLDFMSAKIQAG